MEQLFDKDGAGNYIPIMPVGLNLGDITSGTSKRLALPSGTRWIKVACEQNTWVKLGGSTVVAKNPLTALAITGIILTGTDPVKITIAGHGLLDGDRVSIRDIVGTTGLNEKSFTITKTGTNDFTLNDTVSSDYVAWSSAGTVTPVSANPVFAGMSDFYKISSETYLAFIYDTVAGSIVVTCYGI